MAKEDDPASFWGNFGPFSGHMSDMYGYVSFREGRSRKYRELQWIFQVLVKGGR